jgi:hypothetical protein
MNINGALIHRTPENITITNSEEMKEMYQKRKIHKYQFKKINYYFREGTMVFLLPKSQICFLFCNDAEEYFARS